MEATFINRAEGRRGGAHEADPAGVGGKGLIQEREISADRRPLLQEKYLHSHLCQEKGRLHPCNPGTHHQCRSLVTPRLSPSAISILCF